MFDLFGCFVIFALPVSWKSEKGGNISYVQFDKRREQTNLPYRLVVKKINSRQHN